MMFSDHIDKIVTEFKKKIESLPLEERDHAISQMTDALTALNHEVLRAHESLREAKSREEAERIATKLHHDTLAHVSDYF